MYCCCNCFISPTLKEYINEKGTLGDCEFCPSRNIKIIEVCDLYDYFEPIFGLYRELEYGIDYFEGSDPLDYGNNLPYLIQEDWPHIFSDEFNHEALDYFWESLIEVDRYDKDDPPLNIHDLFVRIDNTFDELWDSFSDYLKRERRFTINREDLQYLIEILPEVLSRIEINVIQNEYFRARLGLEEGIRPFPCEKMGAPPPEKTLAGGRANPSGISFLYLSDDPNTAISEIRPWKGALVSVATFRTIREIKLIDLTSEFNIEDPFTYGDNLNFMLQENGLLMILGRELSKPVNPDMINIEYIPTQYLTEIIRSQGYDGIIYPSALGRNGTKNIVLFNENNVICHGVRLYEVDNVNYVTLEI